MKIHAVVPVLAGAPTYGNPESTVESAYTAVDAKTPVL
jgi:hypothetical protein